MSFAFFCFIIRNGWCEKFAINRPEGLIPHRIIDSFSKNTSLLVFTYYFEYRNGSRLQ